jgi:hypothetical protein
MLKKIMLLAMFGACSLNVYSMEEQNFQMNDYHYNNLSKILANINKNITYELDSSYDKKTIEDIQGDILQITTAPSRFIFEKEAQELNKISELLASKKSHQDQLNTIKEKKEKIQDLLQEILAKADEYNTSQVNLEKPNSQNNQEIQNINPKNNNKNLMDTKIALSDNIEGLGGLLNNESLMDDSSMTKEEVLQYLEPISLQLEILQQDRYRGDLLNLIVDIGDSPFDQINDQINDQLKERLKELQKNLFQQFNVGYWEQQKYKEQLKEEEIKKKILEYIEKTHITQTKKNKKFHDFQGQIIHKIDELLAELEKNKGNQNKLMGIGISLKVAIPPKHSLYTIIKNNLSEARDLVTKAISIEDIKDTIKIYNIPLIDDTFQNQNQPQHQYLQQKPMVDDQKKEQLMQWLWSDFENVSKNKEDQEQDIKLAIISNYIEELDRMSNEDFETLYEQYNHKNHKWDFDFEEESQYNPKRDFNF